MRRAAYAIMLAFGIFLLVMPISVPVFHTSADFSVFNTNWNGASKFGKLLYEESRVVPVITSYNSFDLSERKGVLLILGPDMRYSPLEVGEVKNFLNNGGTLVLIDDFGTGNDILEGLNLSARFLGITPIDVFYSKNYNFPEVVRILDPQLGIGVDKLILNVPSAIIGANGSIYTSKVTVVGNNQRELPVMSEVKYGKGKIILFADPSVFINDMFDENEPFIRNFVRYLNADTVYIDEAHHSNFNPYAVGTLVIRRSLDRVKAFYVVLAVAVTAILVESGLALKGVGKILELILGKIFKEEEKSLDEVIEKLKKEGYDESILRKMIKEIETGKKLGG
ncbi:hypothetical protein OCC_01269 [Thermococcus litoralis DSM 5473]|uniref:DUF4350 domain-containing protein n=1 Tax=Thermococcus litoralis (strain ATCC 51850 / DSM 5473 / JCM 8560 / NS-C) TaxID=523849 RepID=H3ZLQ5_THELN|nr:DUF4350 domain-containing protein [Thermococcus litoralis]EHR79117.1 hypothetical protein OCC_01269 [Thermococcus litoralis DSM 5473]